MVNLSLQGDPKPIERDKGPGYMTTTDITDTAALKQRFTERYGQPPAEIFLENGKYLMAGPVPETIEKDGE